MADYYSTSKQKPHPNSRVAWPFGGRGRELHGWYDGKEFRIGLPNDGLPTLRFKQPPARWRYLKLDER